VKRGRRPFPKGGGNKRAIKRQGKGGRERERKRDSNRSRVSQGERYFFVVGGGNCLRRHDRGEGAGVGYTRERGEMGRWGKGGGGREGVNFLEINIRPHQRVIKAHSNEKKSEGVEKIIRLTMIFD